MGHHVKVSALDLGMIRDGEQERDTITSMTRLAQYLDTLGYTRYWISEHHNMANLVSSATVVLIQHMLAQTTHIRVGSGGIMLPNHAPLIVAEQFGTLETLYPNRVDLGLGRAPGTDMATASALRRDQHQGVYAFPEEIDQLATYFGPAQQQQFVKAYPAVNTHVPLYVLGSSTDSAYVAARKGLPYVFAGHFAPTQMKEALNIYRTYFEPSEVLDAPYVMVGMSVIMADTDEEAHLLASTLALATAGILSGRQWPMQPPTTSLEAVLSPEMLSRTTQKINHSFVGSPKSVAQKLEQFVQTYGHVDEFIAVSYIYDTAKQHHSYKLFKDTVDQTFNQ